ncbi:MAG: carboxylesterase family protein [Myxococcota bacterium]
MSETATTRSGRLRGRLARAGGLAFRGIPFAEPPIDALRFRAPQQVRPWTGVREARGFGASAPQAGVENWLVRRFIGSASVSQSEDCLYLNVWTPALDGGRRPVMVFIHGGAFLMGSGSTLLYDGSRLASRGDVVVVTLNYRLGALGSLDLRGTLGADSVPANLGLRDQLAALHWVRANIEAFGGDPEAVTLFGESAGAMSIGTLLGTPVARGLFRRAILQSGAAHNVSSPEQAGRVAELFLKLLGPHGESLARLREAPLRELLRAQREATFQLALPLGGLAFQPCIDGDLLPESPLDALARGSAKDVALLAGTNRDEWKLFLLADVRARRMDEAALRRRFARVLAEPEAERAYQAYRRAPQARRPDDTRERWSSFQGDRVFHWPAARLLELAGRHSRENFAYSFTWSPPLLERQIGACHGIELPFVFGTILEPWLRPWLGALPGARKLSHRMQEAWLAFAKTGHPGHAGIPFWPAWDTEKRQAMKLGRSCAAIPSYAESAVRFFDGNR